MHVSGKASLSFRVYFKRYKQYTNQLNSKHKELVEQILNLDPNILLEKSQNGYVIIEE